MDDGGWSTQALTGVAFASCGLGATCCGIICCNGYIINLSENIKDYLASRGWTIFQSTGLTRISEKLNKLDDIHQTIANGFQNMRNDNEQVEKLGNQLERVKENQALLKESLQNFAQQNKSQQSEKKWSYNESPESYDDSQSYFSSNENFPDFEESENN
jgi:hypothetical protein